MSDGVMPSEEHEALCVMISPHGWDMTLAFRHGSPESLLAKDMANVDEARACPRHLITASMPVERPCVTVQTAPFCVLESPQQVKALAQWLLAASIAMERMETMEGFDDGA